jgi:2-desacetyl-2-hydroxyethyl bacteriochlorophyllide A dehydrogenase
MKALVWEAPRVMVMRDADIPQISEDQALIRVTYAGICGSELSGYLGHNALRVPPLVMGHEFAGTIAALGAAAQQAHPELSVGQNVTVNPLSGCNECSFCTSGLNHLCQKRVLLGAHRPGAYAEYVAVPAHSVVVLPENVDTRLGALAEPVAVAVRVGELAGDVQGKAVLIIGAGPIGLLSIQILQNLGASRIFVADLDAARLAMAGDLGAEMINPREVDTVKFVREATGGEGVPVSVDAVGTAGTRAQCVSATRSTGTLILCGLHEETSAMPAAEMIRREIVARGTFAYSPANFLEAVELLAKGAIRLDPWIVEADLSEGGKWFDRLIDEPGNVAKVLLVPPSSQA